MILIHCCGLQRKYLGMNSATHFQFIPRRGWSFQQIDPIDGWIVNSQAIGESERWSDCFAMEVQSLLLSFFAAWKNFSANCHAIARNRYISVIASVQKPERYQQFSAVRTRVKATTQRYRQDLFIARTESVLCVQRKRPQTVRIQVAKHRSPVPRKAI